ncbi:hypothetical protein MUK42_02182 [Musa troglodytarum]|uniref:Uncharacterized protein n=1 Tax=Musa troglodytarum TaxID=320322 RepID=A0A9E7K1K2_9LILI|nr:hypothetical protein MUK42_02182 [Musa troglodytarum]
MGDAVPLVISRAWVEPGTSSQGYLMWEVWERVTSSFALVSRSPVPPSPLCNTWSYHLHARRPPAPTMALLLAVSGSSQTMTRAHGLAIITQPALFLHRLAERDAVLLHVSSAGGGASSPQLFGKMTD